MSLNAVVLFALIAFVVFRESRLAEAREAGKALARESMDYVRFLSFGVMMSRSKEEWLESDAVQTRRREFIASMSRVYEVSGKRVPESQIAEFVPSLIDVQQWSRAESMDAGGKAWAAKYAS